MATPPLSSADEPAGITCEVHIDAAGLPHRTPAMLERDRAAVKVAINLLLGRGNRGRSRRTPTIDTQRLHAAAVSDVDAQRRAAALLIGRCRATSADADARLVPILTVLVDPMQPPAVRTEAAMSQILRGAGDEPREVLVALAAAEPKHSPWHAAAYLAQAGDPSGWPAVIDGARSDYTPWRVEALGAAVAFGPSQGQTVAGGAVDPHGLIAAAVADGEITVRQSVPRWLVGVEHPDALRHIRAMAEGDPADGVRVVARHVLSQLEASPR